MRKKKIVAIVGISVLAAIAISINVVALSMKDTLNSFAVIGGNTVDSKTLGQGQELSKAIVKEGSVLVENKDNALPLSMDTDSKVNVFGWSSSQWIYGGSGSGRVTEKNDKIDFIKALNDYGIETNEDLTSMYKAFANKRPKFNDNEGSLHSYPTEMSVLYEPNINDKTFYSDNLLEDAKNNYSTTAFVVLGRVSGESNDQPKIQSYSNSKNGGNVKTDASRSYLDVSKDEEELLDYVSSNYEKTVVIINSDSEINLSFLKKYPAIDACLIVGATGDEGAEGIPSLLYGDVAPSGRLTDTYVYDFKSIPSNVNAGPDLGALWGTSTGKGGAWGRYTDADGMYPYDGTTNGNVSGNPKYDGVSYVDYAEDIYVGYKWFETADAEGYFSSVDNEYGKGYDGIVQYPFGYGLSYTTFNQKIVRSSISNNSSVKGDEKIDIDVTVTNTGDVAGSDAVQLYISKPYTKGGIEKSAVELLDFAKTPIIDAGESVTVTLTVNASDFASYDAYDKDNDGFKGYEIEMGDYKILLKNNSHDMVSDTASQTTLTYKVNQTIYQENDPVTGEKVHNQFDAENSKDGVAIDGFNSGQGIKYLSRNDFNGSFPSSATPNRAMSQELKNTNLYTAQNATDAINNNDQAVTFGENNGLKVSDDGKTANDFGLKLGKDYNDPDWDKLLNQVTKDEMMDTTLHGYVKNKGIGSINKPLTAEVDGPAQVGSFNVAKSGIGYPNAVLMAQTFDKQIALQYGKQLGTEAYSNGYSGLYAPGMNLHRSPFGGRNYEYYSEDPYLSGMMGAYVIKGAKNVGVYMYIKHLAVYEQENYRDGLYTWLTEQNLRENYLKPFEIAVKVGGATGFMTSYNRLGATWTGGNINLIKNVVETEWGFKGAIITDYADHHNFMNMDQALRAGGTLFMDGFTNNGSYQFETESNTFNQALREATKRNIYTWLNAEYTRANPDDGEISTVKKGEMKTWWPYALAGVDVLFAAGIAVWAVFGFIDFKKKDKKSEPEKK